MSRDRRGEQAEEREMEVEGSEEGEGEVEETGQGRKTKTGRNVRFSHDENCVLVHNIIPCYEVILGNLAARTPLRRRHQLWGRVCEAVNAVGPLKRTVAHCRKRFSDIKRRLKEKMAQERRSTRRTGGGPPLRMEYTTYKEELRQIMPAEIVEGINVQDTDSPSFGQVVESPGPQFSPSARPTPPPSARDSGTDEQAGPSSYQPPQAESLEMSPEPEDLTTITLKGKLSTDIYVRVMEWNNLLLTRSYHSLQTFKEVQKGHRQRIRHIANSDERFDLASSTLNHRFTD
ncbi:uncharacterized protein LOC142139989 [Mixophyes fleayi]|uniref:uncharacterized protein LOC142139989 n=1 Tax=Mixophyes fleayi TaxID=3061075 RepID=UPI003F4D9409